MGYRKVTYTEQCWYILKFWIKEKLRSIKLRFYKQKDKEFTYDR